MSRQQNLVYITFATDVEAENLIDCGFFADTGHIRLQVAGDVNPCAVSRDIAQTDINVTIYYVSDYQ